LVTKEPSSRVSRIVNDVEKLAHLLLDLRKGHAGRAGSPVVASAGR
jgi:hypothetical protein